MGKRPGTILIAGRSDKGGGRPFVKSKEIEILIQHRLEQAQEALDDAKYLIDGNRSPQSIINRSYYAMFYASLALLQQISKTPSRHSGVKIRMRVRSSFDLSGSRDQENGIRACSVAQEKSVQSLIG